MQATTQSFGGNTIALVVLGIIAAVIAIAAFTNTALPLIGSPRVALVVLIVVGFAMCTMGMAIPQYGWTNPFNVAGTIVGVMMIAIGAAAIFGIALPFIANERAAILAIAALMVVKVIIAGVRGIVS